MFVYNVWYVAGYSSDVEAGKHISRKYLNEPVVLFRTSSGVLSALEDRCSHRCMPLSAGHVDGEIIRCCYHGMEFNTNGTCAKIPHQKRIPKQAAVRCYPIVERDSIIWIWMGNPELSDDSKILSNPEHSTRGWTWRGVYMHVAANWQLIVDNILDLTHLAYVHAGTIGGNAESHFAAKNQVNFDSHKVQLVRHLPNSVPPATYTKAGKFNGLVDRWQEVDFEPRMGMVLRVNAGACDVGTGAYEGKRAHGFMLVNIHGITPETETTTHYIWSVASNAPVETGAPEILFEQISKTISEDETVLELQQARISDMPHAKFLGIASDGAVNQGRRLLSTLYEAEHAERLTVD
jgi:vanillate O-demethylase monooxygenase subunit